MHSDIICRVVQISGTLYSTSRTTHKRSHVNRKDTYYYVLQLDSDTIEEETVRRIILFKGSSTLWNS